MMPARPRRPRRRLITPTPGVDLDRLPVEQHQLLAGAAPAHVEPALQLVEVEDVRRPPELEHHVVGDVDQRGDRALAGALEALLHPVRRRRARVRRRGSRARRSGRTGRAPRSAPAGARRSAARPARTPAACSAAPVIAATSRATPTTLRQSARFGVSLIVSTAVVEVERRRGCPGRSARRRRASAGRCGPPTARARAPSTACPATRRRASSCA